jgi:hypothetical protein
MGTTYPRREYLPMGGRPPSHGSLPFGIVACDFGDLQGGSTSHPGRLLAAPETEGRALCTDFRANALRLTAKVIAAVLAWLRTLEGDRLADINVLALACGCVVFL